MEQNKEGRRWGARSDRSRSKQVTFRVSLEEFHDLQIEATRRHLSLSELLRMALDRLLGGGAKT